jgi:predicted ATPase
MNAAPLLREVRLDPGWIGSQEEFPFTLPAVRALADPLSLDAPVTFLIGENGSGKSTIVEAIADKLDLDAEGGDTVLTFVKDRSDTALADLLVLVRGSRRPSMRYFLRAESFFNVARTVDAHEGALKAHGGKALHGMSHGESFLTLALERFYPDGLFLLDEPEAALSPQGCITLLRRMHELALEGAQFVIATHSPILMAYPGARIYTLGEHGIEATAYRDTDHYRLTRTFLEEPERFLHHLFA